MVRFEGLLIVFLVGVSRTLGSSGCDLGALSSPGSSIWWDPQARTCTPDLCGGADLSDIPDASGYLPSSLACQMELFDADAARLCLQGKRILLLGDSTMTEAVHDLVMLISGLAHWPDQINTYVYNATSGSLAHWPDQITTYDAKPPGEPLSLTPRIEGLAASYDRFNPRQGRAYSEIWVPYKGMKFPHGLKVQFYGNHRNMTVTAPMLGINIKHRFTGHVDLNGNNMGLDTFFHKDFQQEFNCMVDPQPGMGCPNGRPDMIVVNSGMHDTKMPISRFAMSMHALAQRLKQLSDKGVTVAWRGNNALPHTHGMDVISRHYIESEGLPFVDTRAIEEYFKNDIATGCCTDLTKTGGAHIGAIAKFHNESSRLTVSSMVTQGILNKLCGSPMRTEPVSAAA